jgi:hypothetical protein
MCRPSYCSCCCCCNWRIRIKEKKNTFKTFNHNKTFFSPLKRLLFYSKIRSSRKHPTTVAT